MNITRPKLAVQPGRSQDLKISNRSQGSPTGLKIQKDISGLKLAVLPGRSQDLEISRSQDLKISDRPQGSPTGLKTPQEHRNSQDPSGAWAVVRSQSDPSSHPQATHEVSRSQDLKISGSRGNLRS